jgi:hypothetical protein
LKNKKKLINNKRVLKMSSLDIAALVQNNINTLQKKIQEADMRMEHPNFAGPPRTEFEKLKDEASDAIEAGKKKAAKISNQVSDAFGSGGAVSKNINKVIDYAKENPGHAAAGAAGLAGLIGAGIAAKKYMNARKK